MHMSLVWKKKANTRKEKGKKSQVSGSKLSLMNDDAQKLLRYDYENYMHILQIMKIRVD